MKVMDQEKFDQKNVFGKGNKNDAYAMYFTGTSYLNPLTKKENGIFAANVTFEPGCRNHWHIHHATKGGGQLLIATAGEGWYQEEGKEAISMSPGTVIMIPSNVKHWHGAKKDSYFSHIAIEVPGENCSNEWCDEVTEEEYGRLSEKEEKNRVVQTAGRDRLADFAPDFAHFNDDVLFGEAWNNEDIDLKTRCLVTVIALVSQGITDSSLRYHFENAKKHGVTEKELVAALTHIAFYVGWPKIWASLLMAKEVYRTEK